MKRKVPEFLSDEEAAAFLDQNLSELDFASFRPTHFESEKKATPSRHHGSNQRPARSPVSPPLRPRSR